MLKVPLLIAQEIRKYVMSETTFHFLQLCAQLIVLQFFFVQKQRKYKKEKNSPKVLIISLALIMCCYKFEVCRNTSFNLLRRGYEYQNHFSVSNSKQNLTIYVET